MKTDSVATNFDPLVGWPANLRGAKKTPTSSCPPTTTSMSAFTAVCPAALDDLDDAEHSAQTKGIAVIKKTVLCAAVIGASAVLTSSAVAQANPATPMPVIESSAAQLCGAINGNPTEDGVIDGMNSLENRGLDEMDGALVLITAIHHVCPQHEALMMGIMGPIAAEEICSKPS